MTASLAFFPVSNGDMTLIRLDNGQAILIDVRIRAAADKDGDDTPDVASDLRKRLDRDEEGRLHVDVFLSTHPHQDHITGLQNHFHLGPPDDWDKNEDKIVIGEMWSSPLVFRRADARNPLCDDADAWADEARRRAECFRDYGFKTDTGDRILVMGKDKNDKNNDIRDIVVMPDETVTAANRVEAGAFEARLLAPRLADSDEEDQELSANESSVIMQFSLAADGVTDQCRFLTGGDAEVAIWKALWKRHGDANPDWLSYNILQTPHHCSWRSLSFDSWSDLGEDAQIDVDARDALSQTRKGAVCVASCKPVKVDDDNPPHDRAKREYVDIVDGDNDRFYCTGEHWNNEKQTLEFEVKASGIVRKMAEAAVQAAPALGISATAAQPRQHG